MVKHILGKAIWQAIILFVCLFAGEYFILEPVEKWRYGRDSKFVYPGRAYTRSGAPLYIVHQEDGSSRHMTFIFTMFVLMQIFNMFPARKIRDELNIFTGLFSNYMFFIVFLIIVAGQIVLTQFGGLVMKVHPDGLSPIQWLEAVVIGATMLIIDFFLKFVPDQWFPKLGQDSQDDRMIEQKRNAQTD